MSRKLLLLGWFLLCTTLLGASLGKPAHSAPIRSKSALLHHLEVDTSQDTGE